MPFEKEFESFSYKNIHHPIPDLYRCTYKIEYAFDTSYGYDDLSDYECYVVNLYVENKIAFTYLIQYGGVFNDYVYYIGNYTWHLEVLKPAELIFTQKIGKNEENREKNIVDAIFNHARFKKYTFIPIGFIN